MLKRKSLVLSAAIIATIALFSVAKVRATGYCDPTCPDIVDPEGKFFECNNYRVEASDPKIAPCSDDEGQCTLITYYVLRKPHSKPLRYAALLHNANIELVGVTCDPECTFKYITDGRGDSRQFGRFQTSQNTIKVYWGEHEPVIGTPAKIKVESRGNRLTISPNDQLYKVKHRLKFCDQVFGALIAVDEPQELQPGQSAARFVGSTLINRDVDPPVMQDICVEVLDAAACIANLYDVACTEIDTAEPVGSTTLPPLQVPIGVDHIVGFNGSLTNSERCGTGTIELNQGCWVVTVGGRPIAYIPTGCR